MSDVHYPVSSLIEDIFRGNCVFVYKGLERRFDFQQGRSSSYVRHRMDEHNNLICLSNSFMTLFIRNMAVTQRT